MRAANVSQTSISIPPSRPSRRHFATHHLEILRTSATGAVYSDVLSLRRRVLGQDHQAAIDKSDEYSEIYCAYVEGVAVGTMRVTRASNGPLDCEEVYPRRVVKQFKNRLGSASGFCVLSCLPRQLRLARMLVEAVWIDQLTMGIRVDIINAHERGVRYYQRLGYRLVANSYFVHPRLRTPSYVLMLPADPLGGGQIAYLFEGVQEPVTFEELDSIVRLTTHNPRKRRRRQDLLAGQVRKMLCDFFIPQPHSSLATETIEGATR